MNSREPRVYAEFQKIGANEKWNEFEYDILSRLCSYVEGVDVYDNGRWGKKGVGDARYVTQPHSISLLCVPGAILKENSRDSETLVEEDGINEAKYKALYKEKLLTAFYQANESAKQKGKRAFITTPVIGDGAFAGSFRGKTAKYFYNTLAELLKEHPEWNNIASIWIDGYLSNLCKDETIQSTLLRIRNTGNENQNKDHALFSGYPYSDLGQLSKASEYAESAEEEAQFSQCDRFKIFAWDHFSYEGNDWIGGTRTTDEANMASCNALSILFGEEGEYRQYAHEEEYAYLPKEFGTWWECFTQQKDEVKQSIEDRLYVLENGELTLRPDPKQALKELKQDINSPKLTSPDYQSNADESKSEKPEQPDESKSEKTKQPDESKPEKTKQPDESKPEKPEQTDEPKNPEQSNKSQSENSKKPDQKTILANIVGTLIKNIETKSGKRFTSGINSKKVQQLKNIQTHINSEDEIKTGSEKLKEYTQNIMNICKIKRNPIHFWRSPNSVKEYLTLLKENNIKFTPKTKTPKPK
jgi:hypothetical protein